MTNAFKTKPKLIEFFDVAADWGQYREVDVVFFRRNTEWFARATFAGGYSADVAPLLRTGKQSDSEYEKAVFDKMSNAAAAAHRSREGRAAA